MHNKSNYPLPAKVGVIGANGYTGRELCRLLLSHPKVNLSAVFTRDVTWALQDELPETGAADIPSYLLDDLDHYVSQLDVVFLATPVEISMDLVAKLAAYNLVIIDLSGAFRLPQESFEIAYAMPHSAPKFIESACYGLSPWWHKNQLSAEVTLIANPGCYATCALMALLPVLQTNLLKPASIIIDAKSGVSGAGRKAANNLLYCEIQDNFFPYKIGKHQHQPEIAYSIKQTTNVECSPLLTTHLLPLKRGISMSIYGSLTQSHQLKSTGEVGALINLAYQRAYENYPLIRYGALDDPDAANNQRLLALSQVIGSARTHIGYHIEGDRVVIFASLDNLMKGAASQAIENFNIVHGLPIETGLLLQEGVL